MTRLYLKIYLALLAVVVVFFVLSSLLFWHGRGGRPQAEALRNGTALAEALLPDPAAGEGALQEALDRIGPRVGASVAVFAEDGARLAETGGFLPVPDLERARSHWMHVRRSGPAAALRLADGRWVAVRFSEAGPRGPFWLGGLGLLALVIAVCAYPVARGITRRVERLDARVRSLGEGNLGARADVEGRDEVARLAASFNTAAERIEALVGSQRTLLASASHELRSPLARLRVAAELLGRDGDPELRAQMARDIGELDAGVEELLAVSRLGMLDATAAHESVDFLALVAEEAARTGAELEGEPVALNGDRRSLRHLVRNLLENARRHAPDSPARVELSAGDAGRVLLAVEDRGPGVPEADRERIFEPFQRAPGRRTGSGREPGAGVGLGLSIVRQIAQHHGGEVRCLPREGGGSRFEVTLAGR